METAGIIGFIQGLEGMYRGYIGIMEKEMEATRMGLYGWVTRE